MLGNNKNTKISYFQDLIIDKGYYITFSMLILKVIISPRIHF